MFVYDKWINLIIGGVKGHLGVPWEGMDGIS